MTAIIVIICGVNFVSGNLSNRYDVKSKIKSRSLDVLDALGALYKNEVGNSCAIQKVLELNWFLDR